MPRFLRMLRPACLALAGMAAILPAGTQAASPAPVPDEVRILADTVRARLAKALETLPEAAGTTVGLDALVAPPAGGLAVTRPLGVLKGRQVAAGPARARDGEAVGVADHETARDVALRALAAEFVRRMEPVYGAEVSPGS